MGVGGAVLYSLAVMGIRAIQRLGRRSISLRRSGYTATPGRGDG
jgi:hypothetical protein